LGAYETVRGVAKFVPRNLLNEWIKESWTQFRQEDLELAK